MITPIKFSQQLARQYAINQSKGFRHLIVLSGELSWCLEYLQAIDELKHYLTEKASQPTSSCLVFSDEKALVPNVTSQNYRYQLGTQKKYFIFKDKDLNLDVLCALSGTLVSGGVCIILLPPVCVEQTSSNERLFLKRLKDKVFEKSSAWYLAQNDQNNPKITIQDFSGKSFNEEIYDINRQQRNVIPSGTLPFSCRTQDQYKAVLTILNVGLGHRNRPLIFTADRGRGKSSALAIACSELLGQGKNVKQDILICAPHTHCVDIFFKQLLTSLNLATTDIKNHQLTIGNVCVRFIAVDELLKNKPAARMIFVDEAAGIPVYLLEQIALHYKRIVFSSTIHGYEGAGRGFGITFPKRLKSISPQMQTLHIDEPIRWSPHDPLEAFIAETCLLNANLPHLSLGDSIHTSEMNLECLNREHLINNEALLANVFALLITAHYQTSPNDLKLLLLNHNIQTLILKQQDKIVAVALILSEGGEVACDIQDIQKGKRRIKDQFIPQSLLSHCGVQNSFDFTYHRILRIAVHPEVQNKGIGSYFIKELTEYSKRLKVDFIGASFGMSYPLLTFWMKANFNIARVGFNKDKASGEHSVMVLKSLSEKSFKVYQKISYEFYAQFNYLLSDEYSQLSPKVVCQILTHTPVNCLPHLSANDIQSVKDYAMGYRQYSCCALGIHHWLQYYLVSEEFSSSQHKDELYAFILKAFQKRPLSEIAQTLGFTGKKALQGYMVDVVKNIEMIN